MTSIRALAALCLAAAFGAQAQTLAGIQIEPASVRVGEPVRITGRFDNAENPNCNVRLHFGDGQTQDFKINQAKDVPLVTTRSYAKAGQYKVMIEPKTALPMLKCVGANQTAMLTVAAGCVFNRTEKVPVPPASVVMRPEVGATVMPTLSLSVFITATSDALRLL